MFYVDLVFAVIPHEMIIVISNDRFGTPWNMGTAIAKYDSKSGSYVTIYRDDKTLFHETRVKVSPSNTLIGVMVLRKVDFVVVLALALNVAY